MSTCVDNLTLKGVSDCLVCRNGMGDCTRIYPFHLFWKCIRRPSFWRCSYRHDTGSIERIFSLKWASNPSTIIAIHSSWGIQDMNLTYVADVADLIINLRRNSSFSQSKFCLRLTVTPPPFIGNWTPMTINPQNLPVLDLYCKSSISTGETPILQIPSGDGDLIVQNVFDNKKPNLGSTGSIASFCKIKSGFCHAHTLIVAFGTSLSLVWLTLSSA